MLAKLYPYAKLTERDLSVGALRQLKILTSIMLLLSPWMAIVQPLPIGDEIKRFVLIAIGVGISISCAIMLLNRLSHIIMFPDTYLDEWEIRMKKDAESFAYRVFAFLYMPLFLMMFVVFDGPGAEDALFSAIDLFIFATLFFVPMCILPLAHIAWTQKPLEE